MGQQKQLSLSLREQLERITKQYSLEKEQNNKLEELLKDKDNEIQSLQNYIVSHASDRDDLNNELVNNKVLYLLFRVLLKILHKS